MPRPRTHPRLPFDDDEDDRVVLVAKWAGTCRRCGNVIAPGTLMHWSQTRGAVHPTDDDCARALAKVGAHNRGREPVRFNSPTSSGGVVLPFKI